MTSTNERPSGIGPHEDKELELLLAGIKPLARLHSEPTTGYAADLSAFEPHVMNGTLIREDVTSSDNTITHHYVCLPTEEWRIKLMKVMDMVMATPGRYGFTTDDLHRLDGHILGYSKADIETFIAGIHHHEPNR